MLHLSVVTTLLPHLPHRGTLPFRVALGTVLALLIGLGWLRLTAPAIAVAALAVPLLYLIYLYEVQVYEDEPVWVVGGTFFVGLLLGIPWAAVTGPLLTGSLLVSAVQGPSTAALLTGVLLPVGAQLLMLAGPLLVYLARPAYDEALDGFTFGAAAALGFTLSATLVNLLPSLQLGLFTDAQPLAGTLSLVQRGLLVPLLNASTTGLLAGAIWLRRGERRSHVAHRVFSSVTGAAALTAVVQGGLGLLSAAVADARLVTAVYALAVGVLLVWVRLAIHRMLLSEAVEHGIGPLTPCTHCHRVVPRMAFCPHCGVATRSTPKSGHGRAGRTVRRRPA